MNPTQSTTAAIVPLRKRRVEVGSVVALVCTVIAIDERYVRIEVALTKQRLDLPTEGDQIALWQSIGLWHADERGRQYAVFSGEAKQD